MYPVINIFGKEIGTYAIMATLGILCAGFYSCYKIKQKKLDVDDFIIFLVVCFIGAFIGGHLLYAITKMNLIIKLFTNLNEVNIKIFLSYIVEIFGGMVFYGGLIGGIVAALIYCKIKRIEQSLYADVMALAVPLFHFFARIGCFLAGCCYGIESKFGILYDNSYFFKDLEVVTRFPVQLVESGCNLILFFALSILYRKNKLKNKLFYVYLLAYSVIRFILEFLRGDDYRGFAFGFSTSQIISIGLLIISIICLVHLKNNPEKK